MSTEPTEANRETIRRAFEAWQQGKGAVTDVFAPGMVWRIEGRSAEPKEYVNKRAFIDEVLAPFAARFEGSSKPFRPVRIRSIVADGPTVITFAAVRRRGRPECGLGYRRASASSRSAIVRAFIVRLYT